MEEMNRIPEEVVAGNGAITANEEPIEAVAQETDVAVEVPEVEPVAAEQAEEPAEEAVGDADGAEEKSTQTPQRTRTPPPQIRLDRRHILTMATTSLWRTCQLIPSAGKSARWKWLSPLALYAMAVSSLSRKWTTSMSALS